ncbi:VOC family protein [Paenibacillus sp. KS-LC4]|uniref:VOC family protein n=1 Tax=Paenibacillus sp. KS-LC4 TaxID=2979727 RepID=UPI0030D317FD
MNRFAIGHVLIKTKQLKQAVQSFQQLGFTVTYRTAPSKAYNALIYLQDGSFLELFNPKPFHLPDRLLRAVFQLLRPLHPAMVNRFLHYLNSEEGLNDYALDSVQLEQAEANVREISQAGAKLGKTINKSKTLPDGRKQTWWLAVPEEPRLPFLMSAYDPELACTEQEISHSNGALGIDRLVIDVPDLENWIESYKLIFTGAEFSRDGQQCTFVLGKNHTVVLRLAKQHRLAEIHLITSLPLKNELRLQPDLSHGAAIMMKSV